MTITKIDYQISQQEWPQIKEIGLSIISKQQLQMRWSFSIVLFRQFDDNTKSDFIKVLFSNFKS
jgi:hypothetical protein